MNKKILSGICAAALCLSSIAVSGVVYAAPGLTISVKGDASAAPGKEVTFDVDLAGNPGLGTMELTVDYDKDVVEFVSADLTPWSKGFNPAVNADTEGKLSLLWVAGTQPYTAEGSTGKLTFKVKDNAEPGKSFKLDVTPKFVTDNDDKKVTPTDVDLDFKVAAEANTDQADVDATKAKVEAAVAAMTVSNETTQADVDAVVQKALEGTGVKGVTTAVVTKSDDKTEGKVDVTVALSKGEAAGTAKAAPVISKTDAPVTYTKVPEKAATCTAEGNKEYYKGSDGKLYTLADGKYTETTLAAVTTAKTAHNYVNGVCSVCGEKDPNYVAPVEVTYTKVPAKAATCTATGNIEYYKGSDGKLYTLGNKKYTETTLAEVTTDKIAHNYVNGVCTVCSEKDPNYNPVVVTYYAVNFTGEYIGSGVTVTGSRAAGAAMTLNVPVGYSATVVSGNNRITTVTDGTGTFTMPAANVTVNVESYLGALSTGYKNAYIYSYDSEMNHIKTNSVRGGMTSPEGEVTVKLGSKYAGRSVTLYSGRKNTSSKVDEATLNSNGEAAFSVKSGKNYTLVVD